MIQGRRVSIGILASAILTVLLVGLVSGAIFLGTTSAPHATPPSPNCANPCIIVVTSLGFDNGRIVIVTKGTFVQWRNLESIPLDLRSTGTWSLETGLIGPGGLSRPVLLDATGTYVYYCQVSMLRGEVIVVG